MAFGIAVQIPDGMYVPIIAKFPIDLKEFNCLGPACLNKNERQLITGKNSGPNLLFLIFACGG